MDARFQPAIKLQLVVDEQEELVLQAQIQLVYLNRFSTTFLLVDGEMVLEPFQLIRDNVMVMLMFKVDVNLWMLMGRAQGPGM